ncbi:MAG: hypothetical protein WBR10_04915, partial [Candidatus Acidiferrum sp.]
VVAGFGVALFAFEFVGVARRAVVGVGVLAAVGIEVSIVADGAVVLRDDARGTKKVFGGVLGIAASGKDRDAFAREENVLVEGVAGSISFGEDFTARTKSKPAPLKITRDAAPRRHSLLHPPDQRQFDLHRLVYLARAFTGTTK